MAKVWRIVGWAVLILLVAGIVLGGAGWLSGASLPRMIDLVFGGGAAARIAASTAMGRITGLLQQVAALF